MSFAVFKSTTKVFSEYLFTSCIIYDGIVQVFKCKFSCEKIHWVESTKVYPSESFPVCGTS